MLFAKKEFERNNFETETLGLKQNDNGNIANAGIIVLPVPATRDGVNINCPITKETIPLKILNSAPENIKIFGGGKLDINNYTDYLALDEYALKNAVLTAEGAIAYAIDNTEYSLFNSRVLVIGYGRVGKVLTERLKGFYPYLTVSARNERDFAMLDTLGINHINTEKIADCGNTFDIVFNTVDIKLSDGIAKRLTSTLFIDLATHGGFMDNADKKHNINYIKLPAVPAKTAPDTAGKIIAETVIKYSM